MKHPYEEDERALVKALLTIEESKLSSWEVRFLESLKRLVVQCHSCMSVDQAIAARQLAKAHGLWQEAASEG